MAIIIWHHAVKTNLEVYAFNLYKMLVCLCQICFDFYWLDVCLGGYNCI